MIEFTINHKITSADSVNKFWAGVHWAKRKQWADYWHLIVRLALANIPHRTLQSPVMIEFWFNDRLDLDGHGMVAKEVIDTLVENNWLIGDTRKHVQCIVYRFHELEGTKVRVSEI